jgi:hypothetical protein
MKSIFALLLCTVTLYSYAQNIGVGTNKPLSKLHVAGDLRVDSLAVNASGLVLHNRDGVLRSLKFTGKQTDVLRGDGTFASAATLADASWLTTGNAGTSPAVNFLGTSDAQPLRLRVNNTWYGTLTISHSLIAFGQNALKANTSGAQNIALGFRAMETNTGGSGNIAIGSDALWKNTVGLANIAIGATTLASNTTGENNVAIGTTALSLNKTGVFNIAIGVGALGLNVSGERNLAVGNQALIYNTTGSELTAIGMDALGNNTTGSHNTALGYRASMLNATGRDNTSVGFQALQNNRNSRNTAVGSEALYTNTSGASNVAVGSKALWSNTTGYSSVAIGDSALYSNKGGTSNTAVGELSIPYMTGGNFNVAFGSWTLKSASAVSNNTAVGHNSLASLISGSNNTAIGFGSDVTLGNLTNATAIGYNAKVNASNKVRIGNASVTKIEGQVAFTTPSDGRYKFNVREDVKGLSFIMRLRPVTYQFDVNRWDGIDDATPLPNEMKVSYAKATEMRRIGFIAQEVEDAATRTGFNFSGINKPESAEDRYGLSYEAFVVPLVKGMQEQQRMIFELEAKLKDNEKVQADQQKVIESLLERLKKVEDNQNK